MRLLSRACAAALALVFAAQPVLAQTVVQAVPAFTAPTGAVANAIPFAAPLGVAGPLATQATLALPTALSAGGPATARLAQNAQPAAVASGRIARAARAARSGILAGLRAVAPQLAGPVAQGTLDKLFTNGANASPVADAATESATPGKLSFEEFARAGEQSYYEGRLAEGQHGVVIGLPQRARPLGDPPTDGEMTRRMELPTLSLEQREQTGLSLLQLAGAGKELVEVKAGEALPLDKGNVVLRQDVGRNRHNLIVVKPGRRADKIIVVGGHHDAASVGEGKIDNWSGATMMANLYQAMKDEDTDATYVFVMFAREEDGLVGSRAFVRSLKPEHKSRVRSMVNVDTVGVDGTFSWRNNSTRWLLDLVAKVAKANKLDLKEATLWGGDADSSSFKRFTPAITIFGASQDVIFDIIHSENDTMAVFNIGHYVNTAKVTLALLKALDRENPPQGGRFLLSRAVGVRM